MGSIPKEGKNFTREGVEKIMMYSAGWPTIYVEKGLGCYITP
jgi:hypothetical protein